MSDEMDKETTSRKVTSLPNDSLNRGRISEERTTKVSSNNNNGTGLIVVVLLSLAVGAGTIAYFVNSRPVPQAPILVPSAVDTVKENKSTVIERNNTTIREVSPATPQPTPKVEVNLPITISPAPAVVTPQAPPQATTAPVAPPKPTPTTSPQTATPTPSKTN